MNCFEVQIEEVDKKVLSLFEKKLDDTEAWQEFSSYIERINKAIDDYAEKGIVPDVNDFKNLHLTPNKNKSKSSDKSSSGSSKENVQPPEEASQSLARTTRAKRNAFMDATQSITQQTKILESKENFKNVKIKKEKLSIATTSQKSTEVSVLPEVKTEPNEMPAPTKPAPKKRRQKKGDLKIKQEKIDEVSELQQTKKDSEVFIEEPVIPTLSILSDSDDSTTDNVPVTGRSTRTKTKKKAQEKRSRVPSVSEEPQPRKQSKSDPKKEEETKYEDALSTAIDERTYIAKNTDVVPQLNATVVVDNPKWVLHKQPVVAEPEFTDDESDHNENVQKITVKSKKRNFNPTEPSPVKKKIEAFERLQDEAAALPPRITRTKKRQMEEQENDQKNEEEPKSVVKEKAKIFTPQAPKFMPKFCSTGTRTHKLQSMSASNESLMTSKSASALKASQAEYRERERKRKEKEEEALKKREALIQAQIEEKKRKREEKQLKAQQQREALEKEKKKLLEAQKLKEERHKQLLAEQEEKRQKQKEEAHKKQLMAKLKALEEKKKEEEKRKEEQRQADEMKAKLAQQQEAMMKLVQKQKDEKKAPLYMTTRAPLLPTDDCYDSDDENYSSTIKEPSWARGSGLVEMQNVMIAAGEVIKNSFFSRQAQTPDLQEIFEVIEKRKLKRTSSAVWQKPPRFTMMPDLERYKEDEEDCFSDD